MQNKQPISEQEIVEINRFMRAENTNIKQQEKIANLNKKATMSFLLWTDKHNWLQTSPGKWWNFRTPSNKQQELTNEQIYDLYILKTKQ